MASERGAILVEVVISIVIFAALMGTVGAAIVTDTNAHAAVVRQAGPELAASRVLDRITTELRMAGAWGEDLDRDGVLDAGEDLNENGLLESDWSLGDGTSADALTFNHRTDYVDPVSNLTYIGTYAPPTRYRLANGDIIRERFGVDESGEPYLAQRTVLASGVQSLTFTRTGSLVRVRLRIGIPQKGGGIRTRTLETQTWLRN
ncbi:MAG: PulJ/GspJ family protein [Planctomycetota bacterium]|jgi:hypothetical protein